ncbi:hypothetical protein BD309DRAFT_964132 [Dichomitus squalens]|nr:hypothetical protein BD309DRAFT_964132 [Dichomitus squalens]
MSWRPTAGGVLMILIAITMLSVHKACIQNIAQNYADHDHQLLKSGRLELRIAKKKLKTKGPMKTVTKGEEHNVFSKVEKREKSAHHLPHERTRCESG